MVKGNKRKAQEVEEEPQEAVEAEEDLERECEAEEQGVQEDEEGDELASAAPKKRRQTELSDNEE
jgi:hypothetical protein